MGLGLGRGPGVRRVAADRVEADNVTSICIGASVLHVDWADTVEIAAVGPDAGGPMLRLRLNGRFAGQAPGRLEDVRLDGEPVPAWEPRPEPEPVVATPVVQQVVHQRYRDRWRVPTFGCELASSPLNAVNLPRLGDRNKAGTHRVLWRSIRGRVGDDSGVDVIVTYEAIADRKGEDARGCGSVGLGGAATGGAENRADSGGDSGAAS